MELSVICVPINSYLQITKPIEERVSLAGDNFAMAIGNGDVLVKAKSDVTLQNVLYRLEIQRNLFQ